MILKMETKDQENTLTGSQIYMRHESIYKDYDYRCLKPFSHDDPEKWRTYEMHEFREAANKTQLAEVNSFKYDKNFHNWIDMEVLKDFTKSKKAIKKAWKKSYRIKKA